MSTLSALIQNYPPATPYERTQLLLLARTGQTRYSAWRDFKQLFKKVEAQTLDGSQKPDLPLMAALLHRVDELTLPANAQHVRVSPTNERALQSQRPTLRGNGYAYSIGGRTSYDYNGFRLVITPENSESQGVFAALRRALKLPESSGTPQLAFDIESQGLYFAMSHSKVALDETTIVITYYNREVLRLDVSDPSFPHRTDDETSVETRQYMKRRARRLLRQLSKTQPQRYVALATELFRAHGPRPVDAALNWAVMDALFYSSPRWKQTRPGRGAYLKQRALVIRRREERAPAIWDANLEVARQLVTAEDVPVEACEMALKVLRANAQPLPDFDPVQLTRFLRSESALLRGLASRAFLSRVDTLSGEELAELFFAARPRVRRQLRAQLETLVQSRETSWREAFARALSKRLSEVANPARGAFAAEVLFAFFRDSISDDAFWSRVPVWMSFGDAGRDWALSRVRQTAQRGDLKRIAVLTSPPESVRETIIGAFLEGVRALSLSGQEATALIGGSVTGQERALGWRVIDASGIAVEALQYLWRRLLNQRQQGFAALSGASGNEGFAALEAAMSDENAARTLQRALLPQAEARRAWQAFNMEFFGASMGVLLRRADFAPSDILTWLEGLQTTAFAPEYFLAVWEAVPDDKRLELALSATPEQWDATRDGLLKRLESANLRAAFWRALWPKLNDLSPALQARLVDDADIADTFALLDANAFGELLPTADTPHANFVSRWLDAHLQTLERDDATLLALATHPLPDARSRALRRYEEVGLNVPLALRLAESGLPEPIAFGRAWFEAQPQEQAFELALALCDSPARDVQSFGREWIEARRETLAMPQLLGRLSEHPDPQMQLFVANELARGAKEVPSRDFDAVVLKTRGRARRAKETVKRRLSEIAPEASAPVEETVDTSALLELARGRTTRDREWAIAQLARLSVAGANISGVAARELDAE